MKIDFKEFALREICIAHVTNVILVASSNNASREYTLAG